VEESNDGLPNTVAIRMTEFYGLSREDWLSLVVKVSLSSFIPSSLTVGADPQYCCVLMAKHENEVALEILEHMVYSAIFYNRRCEIALRLALVGKSLQVINSSR
jgi:general transcription factor 3C polypeptide 3 (transcription factor C subunit 4)